MDTLYRPLAPGEKHLLGKIARHDEIEEWLSSKVGMRLMHSSVGGYGSVYCVGAPQVFLLTSSCTKLKQARYITPFAYDG